jgi:hypothetical protein
LKKYEKTGPILYCFNTYTSIELGQTKDLPAEKCLIIQALILRQQKLKVKEVPKDLE